MYKVAVAQFQHESNTFAKYCTDLARFRQTNLMEGEEIISFAHSGVRDYMSGIILTGEAYDDVEMLPLFSAYSMPSGTIGAACYDYIAEHILSGLRSNASQIDGLCLVLHGAGASERTLDVEGAILKACREILGPNIPIISTLDLHANISADMEQNADALISCKLYPHSDCYETGCRAMEIMHHVLCGDYRVHLATRHLPMMVQMNLATTLTEPMKSVLELCQAAEECEGVVDCAFAHGFSCADTPFNGATVLVNAIDAQTAQRVAADVGDAIWLRRGDFYEPVLSPEEGVEKALVSETPVVINEAADNPGGGSPGDATFLLRALIEGGAKRCCFASIVDPETVACSVAAGVGAYVDVSIGGKIDGKHGAPLTVKGAYVRSISDGKIHLRSRMMNGYPTFFGTTVRLVIDGRIDVIVCEVPNQIMDDSIYELMGIDVRRYDIIALKSVVHFRDYFASIAKTIITVDSPGICSLNPENYDYRFLPRPMFPFEYPVEENGVPQASRSL